MEPEKKTCFGTDKVYSLMSKTVDECLACKDRHACIEENTNPKKQR
jgi:hypothetical protein